MVLTCTWLSCGCDYYRVTDLQSRQIYYTKGCPWLMRTRGGGIDFQELGTGDDITLTNSRLTKVTIEEAEGHVGTTARTQNGS